MEEQNKDVNTEETSTSPESSAGITEEKDVEKQVPLSALVAERKSFQSKISDLEGRVEALQQKKSEGQLSEGEKKELDAKVYLRKVLKEVVAEEAETTKKVEETEQRNFESEVETALSVNPEINRNEFLKFIEDNGDKYGIKGVSGAMALYKDINKVALEAKTSAKKEIARRPKFPSNESSGGQKTYDTKGKSISKIAQEAIEEIGRQ